MSTIKRISALAIAGMLGGLGVTASGIDAVPLREVSNPRRRQSLIGSNPEGVFYGFNYRRGPGWSFAHVKRMAKKAKNRAHHRAACRRHGH
jgi:hypothetical protein